MITADFPAEDGGVFMPEIVMVIGPTASGKSDLAVRLAERIDGEIVNADSMQVYRGLTIGTAKPSQEMMSRIPHHLFDLVDPEEDFTAADYCRMGREKIHDICKRGKTPVVTGGTGLYLRALISGLVEAPGADLAARSEYNEIAERFGNEQLLETLRKVDPASAARLHSNNRVRIIRALEVYKQTGRTLSELQDEHGFRLKWCNSLKIGIKVERNELYGRINARVDRMIAEGLVAEVESLLSKGYCPATKALSSIGCREICGFLAGKTTLSESIEQIKLHSRHYAKRQITWFNSDPEMNWFECPLMFDSVTACVKEFLKGKPAD